MLYAITLHVDVSDPTALLKYVREIVLPEFCQHPERVNDMPTRELLHWVYNPGDASFPGTTILNCSITRVDDMPTYQDLPAHALAAANEDQPAADRRVIVEPVFALPGFTRW